MYSTTGRNGHEGRGGCTQRVSPNRRRSGDGEIDCPRLYETSPGAGSTKSWGCGSRIALRSSAGYKSRPSNHLDPVPRRLWGTWAIPPQCLPCRRLAAMCVPVHTCSSRTIPARHMERRSVAAAKDRRGSRPASRTSGVRGGVRWRVSGYLGAVGNRGGDPQGRRPRSRPPTLCKLLMRYRHWQSHRGELWGRYCGLMRDAPRRAAGVVTPNPFE